MTAFRDALEAKIAEDVHWMMMQPQPGDEPGMVIAPGTVIANTRYTRLLRKLADGYLSRLEGCDLD